MKPSSANLQNPSISSPWFVCPQASPQAQARLFFFPYAGGGPAVFSKWFAENIETWIAHYPGRGSRHHEPPINRLGSLVEKLSQAVPPLLDKPFAFFGHSLGGLVAFELAQNLRRNNLPQPVILFVSACGAPHLPDPHPPIHTLPDTEFLNALRQLNGVPSEFLQLPDAMEFVLPILRADFQAIESYVYAPDEPPLGCPIVALGGLEDPRISQERLEGWKLHTDSNFRSQYFPGDHFFINTARESVMAAIADELISSSHANG